MIKEDLGFLILLIYYKVIFLYKKQSLQELTEDIIVELNPVIRKYLEKFENK